MGRREFLHHYFHNGEEMKSMKTLHTRSEMGTGFQLCPEVDSGCFASISIKGFSYKLLPVCSRINNLKANQLIHFFFRLRFPAGLQFNLEILEGAVHDGKALGMIIKM